MRRLFKDEDVKFKKITQWNQEAFFTDAIIGLGDNELQEPENLLKTAEDVSEDDDETLDRLFHIIAYINDVVYVMQDMSNNMYFYCTRMGIYMVKLNFDRTHDQHKELSFRLFDTDTGETTIEFNGGFGEQRYVLRGTLFAQHIPIDTNIEGNGRGLACGVQMDANDILNLHNGKPITKSYLMAIGAAYAMVKASKYTAIEEALMEAATEIGKKEMFSSPDAFNNMLQDIIKTLNEDKEDN